MSIALRAQSRRILLALPLLIAAAFDARADAITDWNTRTNDLVAEAKLGTPPAIRVLAVAHTAAYEAVGAIAVSALADLQQSQDMRSAAVEAAIAAAHRAALTKLLPAQQASIEAAYKSALAQIEQGPARQAGIEAGEQAAAHVLARRADEMTSKAAIYRPHAAPGAWVPTTEPAAVQWPQRKPWLLKSATEVRPDPPPALNSDAWARDYNEVKAIGGRVSTLRSAEQTEIARFWEYSLPSIYYGVVRSVAQMPGRDVAQNARLFAAVAQAMDDAMISVFEAKYHYVFWRPATAIRNGDLDGNDSTERDASWSSLSEAPLHPEYPSAHSILAAAVGTVLAAETGGDPTLVLTTTSPTAKGLVRRWTSIDEFVSEVARARVYEGIHYRTSTEAGIEMGRRIGRLAVAALLSSRP